MSELMKFLIVGNQSFEVCDAAARAGIGSPLMAAEAADMTDTDKVYVYVGDETGYENGHWYYYDGSDWQDGGIYNSAAIQLDTTLSIAGEAADAKAVGDALVEKANIDGEYESMTVGNAEQLVATVGENNKTPYNFRTSGGSIDIGDREVDKLVGGTVVWNQLVQNGNFASTSGWLSRNSSVISVSNNIMSITATMKGLQLISSTIPINKQHRYIFRAELKSNSTNVTFGFQNNGVHARVASNGNDTWKECIGVLSNSGMENDVNTVAVVFDNRTSDWTEIQLKNVMLIDLTAMLGSTIADYIYSLESGTAGAGVAFFRKLFPNSYYAYNAGELMSVKTSAHVMVGFNAYDDSTGKAVLIGGNEYQITGTYTALSYSTGETITPDSNGKFTPSANGELTVTGGNGTDTCVHLVWDGERDGEYEPYVKHEYTLDSDLELRGLFKLDASNNLYCDGDTYEDDGTVTRNYEYRAYASGDESLPDTITDGTHTVTKLTTPTTETADTYQNPQIVDDQGTEEYVDSRAVKIPVGHDTMYQANLRAKLEMMPNLPEVNGDYLLRQSASGAEYVAHISPIPILPSEDGTYVLKCTVALGTATLSWEVQS